MRFDTVLQRHEGAAIAAEVAALRSPTRIMARGVEQDRTGRLRQFQMVVDEPGRTWVLDRQGSSVREHYSDGILHGLDGELEVEFERSGVSAEPVRMATADLFPQWGHSGHSFAPMMVQRLGAHSILLTFEHEADPAFRTTMVVDERDGIARRRYNLGSAIVVTEVQAMSDDENVPARPRFRKLELPTALHY